MIEFLNNNQGAVMACLTFVYVVATVVIVYFNKRSIDEMRMAREEEARPYVFAYLAFVARERQRCTLVIKNYGKSGARITSFSVTPGLNLVHGESDCGFLNEMILAPDQSIRLLAIDPDKKLHEKEFKISISYQTLDKAKTFSENYVLVQQYVSESGYADTAQSGCKKWENALINISSSLDTIKTNML